MPMVLPRFDRRRRTPPSGATVHWTDERLTRLAQLLPTLPNREGVRKTLETEWKTPVSGAAIAKVIKDAGGVKEFCARYNGKS